MNLKDRRIELGLTLEQVGELVGVGKSTVRKWENGLIENMGRDKISKLAKALQVSPLFIMHIEDPDNEKYIEDSSRVVGIYNQLNSDRRKKVINFATEQLNEQKELLSYPESNEIHTIAAHRVDENETASPEDKDRLMSKLAEMNAKFDASQKRIKELEAKKRGDSGE